jgi:hypothetical protein
MLAMSEDELTPTHDRVERVAYSEELVDMFGSIEIPALPDDVREGQIEEELPALESRTQRLDEAGRRRARKRTPVLGPSGGEQQLQVSAQACSHDLRGANFLRSD